MLNYGKVLKMKKKIFRKIHFTYNLKYVLDLILLLPCDLLHYKENLDTLMAEVVDKEDTNKALLYMKFLF